MAPRERNAWIGLVTALLAYGLYAWILARELAAGRAPSLTEMMIKLAVGLVVLQVALRVLTALADPQREGPADERERVILLRADSFGFHALLFAAFCSAMLLYVGASPLVMANAILLSLGVAEIVREAGVVLGYRLGR